MTGPDGDAADVDGDGTDVDATDDGHGPDDAPGPDGSEPDGGVEWIDAEDGDGDPAAVAPEPDLVDRGARRFDGSSPVHLLAVGLVSSVLVTVYGLSGVLAAAAVVWTWVRVGPVYAVAAGAVGAVVAAAMAASLGESVAVLAPPPWLEAGTTTALAVQAVAGASLPAIPLAAYLQPGPRYTLGAVLAVSLPIAGTAALAATESGFFPVVAGSALAVGLALAAVVHRYEAIALPAALGGEFDG